ncbi:acetamidase/formamidase family protein [Clostridiaceae bacterium 35-E11]
MTKFLEVKEYVDIIGGAMEMLGPVKDGDEIRGIVSPGCWGPMITPSIRSGHEVTRPVEVEGANPGDVIALYVKKIRVLSNYAASGTSKKIEGRYKEDPTVNAYCPHCHTENPETYVDEIGENAIKCSKCHHPAMPQTISNGYTILFDQKKKIGLCVNAPIAHNIAKDVLTGKEYLPEGSRQHLATILAKSDIHGVITRVRPMIGNIGCMPSKPIPSSRNGGDMLHSLNTTNIYGQISKDDLTDAHMDVNSVCEGSIVLCPVKVKGGGVYFGDVHSIQGNGELAMHTVDVTSEVHIGIKLIKNLNLEGPMIIPPPEEIDHRFRPITDEEYQIANELLRPYKSQIGEQIYPIQFVGSGKNLNDAIENGIERISKIINYNLEEVKNRATISGEVEIGRTSGLVYLTMMLPESKYKELGLHALIHKMYNKR